MKEVTAKAVFVGLMEGSHLPVQLRPSLGYGKRFTESIDVALLVVDINGDDDGDMTGHV
ncbi:MAG: hypothetical protein AAGC99_17565 [Pseudomonadota bacterium]